MIRTQPLPARPIARVWAALAATCACLAAHAEPELGLRTISSRPDVVSGGDSLVEVAIPDGTVWKVTRDGHDITPLFRRPEKSARYVALVDGLTPGKHTLDLRAGAQRHLQLDLHAYPLSGPIFTGPHQVPFICQTVANGLSAPLDKDCYAERVIRYYYKSTHPDETTTPDPFLSRGFKTLDPNAALPSDIAQTVTSDGTSVNYIVRREIGVINRAVYDIQFLHQPGTPLPTPWSPKTAGWNGRLVYYIGENCDAGYRQGTLAPAGDLQEPYLSQGYAIATSTLNIPGVTCNDKVSAETLSMVKEHFIKQHGMPVHTIGRGHSGGAVQLYLIAQNFPGLLDGILPSASFPDVATFAESSNDCSLLDRAIKAAKQQWTPEQMTAVSGFSTWQLCLKDGDTLPYPGSNQVPWVDPEHFCNAVMPREWIYDRKINPKGARCEIYDNAINVFGRNPRTGFARQPLDNVGVQYGVVAFNSGRIGAEQFVELNEEVGGFDVDGHYVANRTEADPDTLRLAYRRGMLMTGGGGLNRMPILDWRWYADDAGDSHDRMRSFAIRARLIAANATAENHVMLVDPRTGFNPDPGISRRPQREHDLMRHMDRWLDNIAADKSDGTAAQKIGRNVPAEIAEGCWEVSGRKIDEKAVYNGPGRCNQLYPTYANPRLAAGAPLTDDVLKCALKPINASDYSHPISDQQLTRLKAVFPNGVCDYSRPGIGQQQIEDTWQHYD